MNRIERYENTLAFADSALKELLEQVQKHLSDREFLLVLLGDHGFPMGEHGITSSEATFYEEAFRTPCLFYWPGRLDAKRYSTIEFSQIDVAPTILDLVGLSVTTPFCGKSILRTRSQEPNTLWLVQPYNGGFLVCKHFPFKHVMHVASGTEHFFNLALDSRESQSCADYYPGEFTSLKIACSKLSANQYLVEHNQIWKPEFGFLGPQK